MKLTHVRVLVDDFPSCFRFYRDVLGIEVTWVEGNDGYADFRTSDARNDATGTLVEITEPIPLEGG